MNSQDVSRFFKKSLETQPSTLWASRYAVLNYLAEYFSAVSFECAPDGKFFQRIVNAIEELRLSDASLAKEYRAHCKSAMGGDEMLSLINIDCDHNLMEYFGFVNGMSEEIFRLFAKDVKGNVSKQFYDFCTVQLQIVAQEYERFKAHVYRQGLSTAVMEFDSNRVTGMFGATELRIAGMASSQTITFSRRVKNPLRIKGRKDVPAYVHDEISFGCERDDMSLSNARNIPIQVLCNYRTAIAMIDEVIRLWDPKKRQLKPTIREKAA